MTPRWPLSRKILLIALLNLALLALLVAVFVTAQFRPGSESLMLAAARDRIRGIGDAFARDYAAAGGEARPGLTARYRQWYGADFFLITGRGYAIAGPAPALEPELMDRARSLLPPPPGARPGPPPRRDGPPPGAPPPDGGRRPPPRLPPESVFLRIAPHSPGYWAGVRVDLGYDAEEPGKLGILLIHGRSIFANNLIFNWPLWLGAGVSILAITAACWLPFIRGLTLAIARMDRATREIAEGRFEAKIEGKRRDELGDLAAQISRMAGRLHSYVTHQKRFLGDIAHELCAPIARIQFALGILERKAADEQRPHAAVLHQQVQEMSDLVNELLSFSRAGLSAGPIGRQAVAVVDVARRAAAREAVGGAPVEIHVPEDLRAAANDGLLLRALSNLLRNAIRYAGACGPVEVRARREGAQVVLTVADCGPGLPEGELENVFAPFYRPEEARARETGGAGLGLAIVRSCVEACGGSVRCRNRQPKGLEVEVRLEAAAQRALDAPLGDV